MSTKRVGAELLQPTCDVRKPLDFPWSAPSCSRAKPASCDSFSRTFDLPVLLPTAFIQNHHKFKLSVVKQPELPSQRSPLGYRPEGIPGQHRFSFPASRSAALLRHLTAPPARPGLPAGAPAPAPAGSRPPPGGLRPAAGQSSPPGARGRPRAEPRHSHREEGGTGLGPAGARGSEEIPGSLRLPSNPGSWAPFKTCSARAERHSTSSHSAFFSCFTQERQNNPTGS